MEKNQDNKDGVKFNSDSEGKNSCMAEAEEQMHSLPDPSSLSNGTDNLATKVNKTCLCLTTYKHKR